MRSVTWSDLEGENAFVVLATIGKLLGKLEREASDPDLKKAKDAFCNSCQQVGPMASDDYKCVQCRNGGDVRYLKDLRERYEKEAVTGDYEHLLEVSHKYAYEFLRTSLEVPEERPVPENEEEVLLG